MVDIKRVATEAIIKRYIKDIKNSPKRSIRNLVDLGLSTAKGKFKDSFLAAAQKMLENENSKYYDLVVDNLNNVDNETLVTFGMNVAYNGCTKGAATIRELEAKYNINIPWSVFLKISHNKFEEYEDKYLDVIKEGETLGIYTWFVFVDKLTPEELSLAKNNENCAFVYFISNQDINGDLLSELCNLHNVMISIEYIEDENKNFRIMRENKLMYSMHTAYDSDIKDDIILDEIDELQPIFTIFFPSESASEEICENNYNFIIEAKNSQKYQTVLWEAFRDTSKIDEQLSGDAVRAIFDETGTLADSSCNIFKEKLLDIFKASFSK